MQKSVSRDKIVIKGKVQQEDTILNIYVPNIGASLFIKQKLLRLKVQICPDTIIVRNLNT
jgi:hypothetical protein